MHGGRRGGRARNGAKRTRRRPDAGTTAVVEDERGWSQDAEGGSATAILARLAGSYTATWTIERPGKGPPWTQHAIPSCKRG